MGRYVLNRRESLVQITEGWMLEPSVVRVSEVEGKIVIPSRTKFTSEQVEKIKADANTMLLFKSAYLAWGEEVPDDESATEEAQAASKKGKKPADPAVS